MEIGRGCVKEDKKKMSDVEEDMPGNEGACR